MSRPVSEKERLFTAAAELPTPQQRQAFLDAACGDNAELRREVEELLAHDDQAGSFINAPAVQPAATHIFRPITEGPGSIIGPYKLLQQIGEGGFGAVYMAEQQRPVRRKVALKIIKPGMDTREVIARFESERQALALMDHPNIARVLDAGATDSGRPYFVMELVKGVPITEYCDKNSLATDKRLALFITVCHAVQHAHQKGVIHRDIKPSNVMVTLHDGQPVPKVIDFGVSKATSQQLTEKTLFTAYGQMIGTPAYMSPEQAEMSGLDIDTRSDTYSLGVLLYELLTGTTPFDGKRLREAGYVEMQRIIREESPPRPSTRVSTMGDALTVVSTHRSTDPKKLGQQLRGDLDVIVMKALEKERGRRYDTPNAFADDVQRFLNREAIVARPASAAYRLKKFTQRNWAAVAAVSAIAAVLVIGTIVSTTLAVHALRQRNLAQQQQEVAETAQQEAERQRDTAEKAKQAEGRQRQLVEVQKQAAEVARNSERELREAAEQKRQDIERQNQQIAALNRQIQSTSEEQRRTLYTAQMSLVPNAWATDNIPWMHDLLNSVRPQPGQTDLRGFEWHYWHLLANSELRTHKLLGFGNTVRPMFSADGSRVAGCYLAPSGSRPLNETGLKINVWNPVTGQKVDSLDLPAIAAARSTVPGISQQFGAELWLSPDAKRLAVSNPPSATAGQAGDLQEFAIRIFNLGDGKPPLTIQVPGIRSFSSVHQAMFSADGTRVAVRLLQSPLGESPVREQIRIWDTHTGQEVATFALREKQTIPGEGSRFSYEGLAINADGSRVATFNVDGVTIWDVGSQQVVHHIQSSRALVFKFSPDGRKLAARTLPAIGVPGTLRGTSDIKVWDVMSGKEEAAFNVPGLAVAIEFSPDGKWLVFPPTPGNAIRSLQFYSAANGAPGPRFKGHVAGIVALGFNADGSRLFTAATDGAVKEWDFAAAARGGSAGTATAGVRGISIDRPAAISSDGMTYVTASWPKPEIVVRRTDNDEVVHTITVKGAVESLVASREGHRIAAVTSLRDVPLSEAGQIGVWDLVTGRPVMPPLTVAGVDGPFVSRPNSESKEPLPNVQRTIRIPRAIGLSADGKLLAYSQLTGTGSAQETKLKILEIDTQRITAVGDQSSRNVTEWRFSPNGALILGRSGATYSSTDFHVFDTRTGRKLWGHNGVHQAVNFSGNGTRVFGYTRAVALGSDEGSFMQIWDAETGEQKSQLPMPYDVRGSVQAALSPDGKLMATAVTESFSLGANAAGSVQVWDVASRTVLYRLQGHSTQVTSIAFSPDGRRIVTAGGEVERTLRYGNGETKLWDAQTGQELLHLGDGVSNLAFTPDGRRLFGYNNGRYATKGQCWDASPLPTEREANLLVEALLSAPVGQPLPLKSEALARIDADTSLAADIRMAARKSLQTTGRDPFELNTAAWQIVRHADKLRSDYERAVAYMTEAIDAEAGDSGFWTTLGLAHYRLQQFDAAAKALERATVPSASGAADPVGLAFLAMTHHHLGNKTKAEDALRRCRDSINVSGSTQVTEWRAYLVEAETLLGLRNARGETKSIAGWGNPVDPLGDCRIETAGETLTITVPGNMHNLSSVYRNYHAPRVLQEVDGDFSIELKVKSSVRPNTQLARSVTTYFGAGLLLWDSESHFLRVERNGYFRDHDLAGDSRSPGGATGRSPHSSMAPMIEYVEDRSVVAQPVSYWKGTLPLLPGDASWIRLERRGNMMHISLSHDGQTWEPPQIVRTTFSSRLRVGVVVVNNSGDEFKAEFSELKLTGPSAQVARWGKVVDPLGDCTVKATEATLSVQVPGTYHDLSNRSDRKNLDAPRILRDVEGDFSIEVKVSCPLAPRDILADSPLAYHGAGILLWHDDKHFLRVERNAYRNEGQDYLKCFRPMIEYNYPAGPPHQLVGNSGKLVFHEHHTWIRLSRRGTTITGALSDDGQTWEEIPTVETTLPPRIKLGLHVINNSKNDFRAEFSELKLTQP